jgi:pimeloyl-ACP methyl ester carboxylesterase
MGWNTGPVPEDGIPAAKGIGRARQGRRQLTSGRGSTMIKKWLIRLVLICLGSAAAVILVLLAGAVISMRTAATPPFRDSAGKVIEGSIASLEEIELGGYRQTVLLRGRDVRNPVLLYLHGGPGSSELPLVRHFNRALEDHYIVVLWDQRGAGKSYSPFIPADTMTIEQFLQDGHELVTILQKRFKKDKIYLVGHSWGSVLGLTMAYRHPGLFHAYIGIGQAVDFLEGEKISLRYVLQRAREQNNAEAIAQLEALKDYPSLDGHWMRDVITQRRWLGEFGGVLYGKKGMQSLFFVERPPEFSVFEFVPFFLGSLRSLDLLWPQILRNGDFRKTAPELQVPVYFVTGRHDYNVPFALTEAYYSRLRAPKKTLIWFERSAHMPNFEEPEKFNDLMIHRVLQETGPSRDRRSASGG